MLAISRFVLPGQDLDVARAHDRARGVAADRRVQAVERHLDLGDRLDDGEHPGQVLDDRLVADRGRHQHPRQRPDLGRLARRRSAT
jgi:hypothetical protein